MTIQRWDPLRDLVQLQERMNHLFDDVMARAGGSAGTESLVSTGWKPPVDIFEQDDRYVLRADLPGVASGDVEIEVENGTLALRGERRIDPAVAREAYLRIERPSGRFAIQIALPMSVDRPGIAASHRDGVLEVSLPKKKERAPSRVKVEVR